ncbi:MAG: hypothetical protein JRJ00_00050 [Deltaproteobacteria bacterium]|nr:hypothetical protein [Deltaproteobacteria bacterium]
MSITEQEIACQRDALNDLSGGNNKLVMNYVDWDNFAIPIVFRKIINDYIFDMNTVPNSKVLIMLASEALNFNIRTLY